MTRVINSISVIGGGSAGWLTALYVKAIMPTKRIVVIESSKIGILGAGEGTTPDLVRLLDALDIPISRLIKETNCTMKNAVKFINWNGGGSDDYFYHGFNTYGNLSPDSYKLDPLISAGPSLFMSLCKNNEDFSSADLFSKLCEENKVPFFSSKLTVSKFDDPITKYTNVGAFAIHFDAVKLAEFLKKIAIERGIIRVDDLVVDSIEDEHGDVKQLLLESGRKIACDFIFDCSGFKSFFNKKFKSEWVSYKEYLPVDTAIPFFLPIGEEEIPPYTQATAMKYGWLWKTPLQHRYGCGYVFDSNLITEEEAVKEIEEYLGYVPEYPRKDKGGFKFSSGYYKTPWVKNVVSVGLSSGFIEPLEATSMWVSTTCLGKILGSPEIMYSRDPRVSNDFNAFFSRMNEEILDFIYYHYLTDRNDTEFWSRFTKDNAPEGLKKILDMFEYRMPNDDDFASSAWPITSWYKVGLGHGRQDIINNAKSAAMHSPAFKYLDDNYVSYKQRQDVMLGTFSNHRDFLNTLAERD